MIPTNDIALFLQKNREELGFMTTNLAAALHYRGSLEDLIQDICLKLLTTDIIKDYRIDFHGPETETKISTYIYPIIKNFIIGKFKTSEYRSASQWEFNQGNFDDSTFFDNAMAVSDYYTELTLHNKIVDENEELQADIARLKKEFEQSGFDKSYSLERRKDKDFQSRNALSFSKLLQYFYDEFPNRDIGRMHGISFMYVTHLKRRLGEALIKSGLVQDAKHKIETSLSNRLHKDPNLLICRIKELKAYGYSSENGFIVLKGSEAALIERSSVKKYPWPLHLREGLKKEGVLIIHENHLVFDKNFNFPTSSTAAAVVLGGHANGPLLWKNNKNVSLKDL